MYALKIETTVAANHHLSIDLPPSFPVGEAEVIILAKAPQSPAQTTEPEESLTQFLDWLKTQPPTGRSKAQIDAQLAEERDSWGD